MSQAHVHSPIAEADYLRREQGAAGKHELVDGEIYAMAGASERHNRLDVVCGDARLSVSLDDLYEDTGLPIV